MDRLKLESAPPAYVQITRVPKHGSIIAKQWGKEVVLQKGDLVAASSFKNFVYDQGKDACSSTKKEKCKDSFAYITFSEWVGKGPE